MREQGTKQGAKQGCTHVYPWLGDVTCWQIGAVQETQRESLWNDAGDLESNFATRSLKHFACHASNGFKYVEWTIVQLESVEDTDHYIAFITLMLYSLNDTDTGISYSICGCSCGLMNWILSNFHIPGHLVMTCDDCIRISEQNKRTKWQTNLQTASNTIWL